MTDRSYEQARAGERGSDEAPAARAMDVQRQLARATAVQAQRREVGERAGAVVQRQDEDGAPPTSGGQTAGGQTTGGQTTGGQTTGGQTTGGQTTGGRTAGGRSTPGAGPTTTSSGDASAQYSGDISGGGQGGGEQFIDPTAAASLDEAVAGFADEVSPDDPEAFNDDWQAQFRQRWSEQEDADESFLEEFLRHWNTAAGEWVAAHEDELRGGNQALAQHVIGQMSQHAQGDSGALALRFLQSTLTEALTSTRAVQDLKARLTTFASDHWYLIAGLGVGAIGYSLQQGFGEDNWDPAVAVSGLLGRLPMFEVYDSGAFQLELGLMSSSPIAGEAEDTPTIGLNPGARLSGDLGGGFEAGLGVNTNLRIAPDIKELMAEVSINPSLRFTRPLGNDAMLDIVFSGNLNVGTGTDTVHGGGQIQLSIRFGGSGD